MESKQKQTWGGIMLIQTFVLKVANSERKILTQYEIFDRITEQTESVITQVCKESKLWIHPSLRRPSFSFTYSFTFTYFSIVYKYIDPKKGILLKKIRNHSKPLKVKQNIKVCHKFT